MKIVNPPSWLCRNCGYTETDAMVMVSALTAGSNIVVYEHMEGHCVVLETAEDFWKECWS